MSMALWYIRVRSSSPQAYHRIYSTSPIHNKMKFSLATITAFAGAISAASLPSAFTLVAEGGKTVLTDGQNAYINANTTDHEILIRKHTPF